MNKRRPSLKDADLTSVFVLLMVLAVLGLFIVYPIGKMILMSFVKLDKPITLSNLTMYNFRRFISSSLYKRATLNSIQVSMAIVTFSVLLGLPLAFIISRIDIPGKNIISSFATLPMILPPFVGAYSWILLRGRNGLITRFAERTLGVTLPSIYGFRGITIAMSLCYYPLVFLMVQGALSVADPFLEESAEVMGAGFLRRLRTIVLPLVSPTIGAAAVTVFMRSIGGFGVPAILGGEYYVLPTLIFFQVAGYLNLNAACAISLVCIMFSIFALVLMNYITSRQKAITMTSTTREVKQITHPAAKFFGMLYVVLLLVISLAPHITVVIAAFSEVWAGTTLPTKMGLGNFHRVFTSSMSPLRNSLILALSATLLCALFGTLVAHTAVRGKTARGRWLIDTTVTIPFILPGMVVGVALLSAFINPPLFLAGTGAIIIISYFVRRMPYVFRSAVGALEGMDPMLEQASSIMGASWATTFRRITIPLIAPSIVASSMITFTTLIGELSITMILYSARWKTVSVAIYEYLIEDLLGPACVLGSIVNVVVLVGMFVANKLLGQKIGSMFRSG